MADRLHVPDLAMDLRLLEASRDTAEAELNRHFSVKERASWYIDNLISLDEFATLVPHRHTIGEHLTPGVREAAEVFEITEDQLGFYGRDVTGILNPLGIRFDKKKPETKVAVENNPFIQFGNTWVTEERHHGQAGRQIIRLLGSDTVQVDKDCDVVSRKGNVPVGHSTARGLGYTSIQESNTADPYLELQNRLNNDARRATKEGRFEHARICELAAEVYKHIAGDELLHRRFLSSLVGAALTSDDPELQAYMLSALIDTQNEFEMPVQADILRTNSKRSIAIVRAGISSEHTISKSQLHMLRRTWKIEELNVRSGPGQEYQEILVAKMGKLAAKIAA